MTFFWFVYVIHGCGSLLRLGCVHTRLSDTILCVFKNIESKFILNHVHRGRILCADSCSSGSTLLKRILFFLFLYVSSFIFYEQLLLKQKKKIP